MAGLNFSNDIEARHFADTVRGKLLTRFTRLQGLTQLVSNSVITNFPILIIIVEKKVNNHTSNFQPNLQPTEQGLLSKFFFVFNL